MEKKLFYNYRERIVAVAKKALDLGLVSGAEGNFSIRVKKDYFAITPSAIEYDEILAEDIVILDLEGGIVEGERKPSSEWRMHAEIYKNYPQAGAVVHVHPIYSTVISIIREEIPVLLDEQVFYIGGTLKVTDYNPSGSIELARAIAQALKDRKAVIIGNHGLVAIGKDETAALYTAIIAEKIAKIYYLAKLVGKYHTIPENIVEEFKKKSYGRYT